MLAQGTRSVSELEVNYPDMLDSVFDRSRGYISHINLEKSPQKTLVIFTAGHSGSDFFIARVASCSEDEASECWLFTSIPAKPSSEPPPLSPKRMLIGWVVLQPAKENQSWRCWAEFN